MVIKMASVMKAKDVLDLCKTNKYFNKILCNPGPGDIFWAKIYENVFDENPVLVPTVLDQIKNRQKRTKNLLNFLSSTSVIMTTV